MAMKLAAVIKSLVIKAQITQIHIVLKWRQQSICNRSDLFPQGQAPAETDRHRTKEALWAGMRSVLKQITTHDVANCLRGCGYATKGTGTL